MIVPTKYYTTPTQMFRDMGVSMVIWANHNLRASINAMQETSAQIYKDSSLVNVEKKVREHFYWISQMCSYISPQIKLFLVFWRGARGQKESPCPFVHPPACLSLCLVGATPLYQINQYR